MGLTLGHWSIPSADFRDVFELSLDGVRGKTVAIKRQHEGATIVLLCHPVCQHWQPISQHCVSSPVADFSPSSLGSRLFQVFRLIPASPRLWRRLAIHGLMLRPLFPWQPRSRSG